MPKSNPSPETRFQKGRAKTGVRQKGTPNKPKSIKLAMREFTDKEGDTLLAWARNLLYHTPDLVEVGDKVINMAPVKARLFKYGLEYAIGLPAKRVADGGHNTLQIVVRHPLGVDPIGEREKLEARQDALEVGRARPGTPVAKAPRPLTQAILKAARAVPEVIADPIDPSLELEPVTDADLPDDPAMDIHEGDMPCARIQCLRELWRGRQDHNRKSWESTTPPCPEGTNAEAPPIPPVAKFEQARQGGRLQSRHAEQATSMKAIVERLATEDGELLYSAIRAGLADGPRTATTTS